LRLYTDQYGERCCESSFGLNVLDFPSIQETIDALPAAGGVVYIPAGTYLLRAGLTITKPNVTLIGEGATTVLSPEDPDSLPVDLLTISAAETRLHRLKFDGLADEADLTNGKCGIVFNGYDGPNAPERLVQHCYLENVIVTGCSKFGLWLRDTILLTAINCEAVLNQATGMRIQGTDPHGISAGLRFVGCAFSNNGGLGVDIGDELVAPDTGGTGQASQTFFGCTLELNQGDGYTLADVGVSLNAQIGIKLEVLSCYCEVPPDGAHQFFRFENCPNATVDDCIFFGNPGSPSSGPDQAVSFVNCAYSRATSNVMQGFKTAILLFDSGCTDAVEMCNRDLDVTTSPRISSSSSRLVGTGQQAIVLPRFADTTHLPDTTTFRAGAMVWVETVASGHSHLQVWDGSAWVEV
jgi:hypothetical protein